MPSVAPAPSSHIAPNAFLFTCPPLVMATTSLPALQRALDARKRDFARHAPAQKQADYEAGVRAVAESGVLDDAINVGDEAPDFALPNAVGETVQLSDALADGPVVLTWYRGGWCPYCNLTLRALQEALAAFRAEGATVMALSPERPDHSLSTAEKLKLEMEVLSDIGQEVAREYGLVFDLTPAVQQHLEAAFGLAAHNGDDGTTLPLAATYVIDPGGIVRYAFLDPDYRRRAEPQAILEALQALSA